MTTLTAHQIATDILNNAPEVIEYHIAPTGASFRSHSEMVGFPVRSYMRVKVGEKVMVHRNAQPSEIALVAKLVKSNWVDVRKVRGIENEEPCNKCPGTGYLEQYAHVENGLCFRCNGSGSK